jgi:tetratricopeptide (TPR) repeat protein
MVELPCVIKLCSLACTLLAAGSKAFDFEFASHLFEAGDRTSEVALAFREGRQRNAVTAAVSSLRPRIEQDYERWLAAEFRHDPAGLSNARTAILSLDFVLSRCLPSAEAVTAAKYDAEAIAELVVETAGRDDPQYRQGTIGARILHFLVWRTFEALQEDEAFCKATEIPFRRQVLRQLAEIGDAQKDLPEAVANATIAAFSARFGRLLETMADRPVARAAEAEGVREQAIIALAGRIAENVEDFDQAMREMERAVEIAVEVQRESRQGTNLGDFVDRVLQRMAGLSADGKYDDAAEVADEAFATWQAEEAKLQAERQRVEAERQRAAAQQGLTILRGGLNQDLLRRNAASAARRIAAINDLETPDPAARFAALRSVQDEWYARGRDQGLNLDLEVAIEIARVALARAKDSDERGTTQNDLGTALSTLGERDSRAARLEEAVKAYRAALEEGTRERVPLDWAMTQMNLGNALMRLGERESGTARLARRWRNGRASGFRSSGRGRRTISAVRSRRSASGRAGRRGSRRRPRPIARRWRNRPASGFRSSGR